MLIRRAVGSGVVVSLVARRLQSGEVALRRASGARSAGQRASEACSRACSGAERVCALVSDLARLRVLAWHGIVQLIVAREGGGRRMRGAAGVQLYFPSKLGRRM